MYTSAWLIRRAAAQRPFRLYCFAYAGGSAAAYRSWQAELDPRIELTAVQLPGRAERMCEAPIASLPELIGELARELRRDEGVPFAFFGHSVGALIAYELARHCQRHRLPLPCHLFVSGTSAPRYRDPARGLHLLPDAELIDVLKGYNGTPPDILQHRELMELVLPAIRADFALSENYRHDPAPLLDVPVTVLAGREDDYSGAEQVDGWQEATSRSCRIHWFDGDHFFLHAERASVIALVNRSLEHALEQSQARAA